MYGIKVLYGRENMICSEEDLINLINSYAPEKIVFWVGAGLDCNRPTCLPRAPELLKSLLKLTCGEEYSTMLLNSYTRANSDNSVPRMESVISEIKRFERELKDTATVLTGFSSFLDAPPNDCHQILAQYLKRGAQIITTNYGNAIAKAFNLQYGKNSFPEVPKFEKDLGLYTYSNFSNTSGKIYHVHGVANNLETLGISLDEVKNFLPINFRKLLIHWISNNYCFIFLGYSCSDSLDINTFFRSLGKNLMNQQSVGIIIDHSDMNFFVEMPNQKMQTILTPFQSQNICKLNTVRFLELIKLHNYLPSSSLFPDFNWLDNFIENITPYDSKLNIYITIGITKALGLKPRQILPKRWYINNDYSLFNRTWYIDYYRMILAPIKNLFVNRSFFKSLYKDSLTKSDMYAKMGFIKKAAAVCGKLSTAEECLAHFDGERISPPIDWQISSTLNRNAQWIVVDILKSPIRFHRKISKHKNDAILIMKCNKIIINLGGNNVLDFFQIITAMRYNGVLSMIYENKYDYAVTSLKDAMSYYKDTSSVTGVIRCTIYLAYVEWLNYKRNKDIHSLEKAKDLLIQVKSQNKIYMQLTDKRLYAMLKIYIHFL